MIFPSIYVDLSQGTDLEYPYIFFASLPDWIAFVDGEDGVEFPGRRNLDYTFKSFMVDNQSSNKDITVLSGLSDDKVTIIDPKLVAENLKRVYDKMISYQTYRVIAISYKSQELAVMMRLLLN